MEIFTNQKICKKIIMALVIVILFQFSVPKQVQADEDVTLGGKLLQPVLDLVIFLGDRSNKFIT